MTDGEYVMAAFSIVCAIATVFGYVNSWRQKRARDALFKAKRRSAAETVKKQ